ncbi:MAG TPA: hypothetical protein VFG45_12625 [Candidatus Nitrosocosmicus sp.]|nr:hypothetical protein [Candidatus Nitrosocosmicus sp.]
MRSVNKKPIAERCYLYFNYGHQKKQRTPSSYISRALYLYLLDLSTSNVTKVMLRFCKTIEVMFSLQKNGSGFISIIPERYIILEKKDFIIYHRRDIPWS